MPRSSTEYDGARVQDVRSGAVHEVDATPSFSNHMRPSTVKRGRRIRPRLARNRLAYGALPPRPRGALVPRVESHGPTVCTVHAPKPSAAQLDRCAPTRFTTRTPSEPSASAKMSSSQHPYKNHSIGHDDHGKVAGDQNQGQEVVERALLHVPTKFERAASHPVRASEVVRSNSPPLFSEHPKLIIKRSRAKTGNNTGL